MGALDIAGDVFDLLFVLGPKGLLVMLLMMLFLVPLYFAMGGEALGVGLKQVAYGVLVIFLAALVTLVLYKFDIKVWKWI